MFLLDFTESTSTSIGFPFFFSGFKTSKMASYLITGDTRFDWSLDCISF